MKNKEDRTPFKETKVGRWLSENAPEVLETVGDLLPDRGVLGIVKKILEGKDGITDQQKIDFERLYAEHIIELDKQLTERWGYDMQSDNWLSKSARPITLLSLTLFLYVFIVLDSANIPFSISDIWIDLYKTVLVTVIGGYFVVRTIDKKGFPRVRS